jgi:hypothetical protein
MELEQRVINELGYRIGSLMTEVVILRLRLGDLERETEALRAQAAQGVTVDEPGHVRSGS